MSSVGAGTSSELAVLERVTATGQLIDVFGDTEWVADLRQFNVRYVAQLGALLSSRHGRLALSSLAHPVPVESVVGRTDQILQEQLAVSISSARAVSPRGAFSLRARVHRGLGAKLPEEIGDIEFGEVLPPSMMMASSATSSSARSDPPESMNPTDAGPAGNEPDIPPNWPHSHHLLARTSPVRNQFFRGTCVAFAAAALVETSVWGDGTPELDLAEQYIYFRARLKDPKREEDGTYLQYALEALQEHGACREALVPYERYNDWGQSALYQDAVWSLEELDADAAQYRIKSFRQLKRGSLRDVKGALLDGQLVCASVAVFHNAWYDNGITEAIGEVELPIVTKDPQGFEIIQDRLEGGHAIAIVGYVDTPDPNDQRTWYAGGGYLLFKNSWGTAWARDSEFAAGFGILPYGYFQRYTGDSYTLG